MKNLFWSLLLMGGLFTSCSDDLSVQDEQSLPDTVEQKVYFEGLGFIDGTLIKSGEGEYSLDESEETKKLAEFFEGVDEPHAYFDSRNRMHIFKSEESRLSFVEKQNEIELRCSENTSGSVSIKFYKHKNYSQEFSGLRQTRYSSGYFQIPNVNNAHDDSNDEISSMKITNTRKKDAYAVVMYKHSNFNGSSAWESIQKCSTNGGVSNMKKSWIWFNAWVNNWVPQSDFNDTTSSIRGFYFN